MIVDIPENLFLKFKKPASYIGSEANIIRKEWTPARLKVCLVYPDLYEVAIANNAIRYLYYLLNRRPDVLAERAYLPYPDFAEFLEKENLPLFSIESHHELRDFDLIAITLPHELCYTNILKILDLSNITLSTAERMADEPIVMAGGVGALNPKPLSKFVDLFYIGEAEAHLDDVVNALLEEKAAARDHKIRALAKFPFIYAPGQKEHAQIARASTIEMPLEFYEKYYLVSRAKSVHDRGVIDIMRGCPNSCRFCLAAFFYRPVREMRPETIVKAARALVFKNGYEEISLTSLSTMDYSCIAPVLDFLIDDLQPFKISISVSSLRVDSFSVTAARKIASVRAPVLTFAPETGSEELRLALNKNIKNRDIEGVVNYAVNLGFYRLKLYYMIGLPNETKEHLDALITQVESVFKLMRQHTRRAELSITISNYVPKAHTPFELMPQETEEKLKEKQHYILQRLKKYRKVELKFQPAFMSVVEGLISRGDERIGELILAAYKNGALLDQWNEYFNAEAWRKAIKDLRLNIDEYLSTKRFSSSSTPKLPWKCIDIQVPETYFSTEQRLFKQQRLSPGCFVGCSRCESCNEDVRITKQVDCKIGLKHLPPPASRVTEPQVFRIKLSKTGPLRFLSHNDFFTYVKRLLRQAGIIMCYTEGFHPHMKIASGYPGALGLESVCEYFDVHCYETRDSFVRKFKSVAKEITLMKIAPVSKKGSLFELCRYEAYLINRKIDLPSVERVIRRGPREYLYFFEQKNLKIVRAKLIELLTLNPQLKVIRFEQYYQKTEDGYLAIL